MRHIDTTEKLKEDEAAKLVRFKKELALDADCMQEQREKAKEDMRFVNVPGGMWEGFLEDEFEDRTRLEFDLVSDFINRFISEWNRNRVSVEYKPDDSKTSEDDAELLNGILRADFRQYSGKMSVDNAVSELSTCGYGCYKLAPVFEDEGDPENDNQRVEWRPLHNAYNTVFFDNAAQRIDKRDARRCEVLTEYTKESFEDAFPEQEAASAYTPSTNFGTHVTDKKIIYVATRYEAVKRKESVFVYNNLQTGKVEVFNKEDHALIEDELKADDLREFVRERKIVRQVVEKTVFSGDAILEKTRRIAGKWIPIIPMYGYRSYVDGAEWYRGFTRKLMDAVRLFNMQVSQLAENSASSGADTPIIDPDQIAGLEDFWADKNNKSYLPLRTMKGENNEIIQAGVSGYLKAPQLDGNTSALMQIVPAYIQQVTGGAPQDTLDPNASGKAINAMRKREDLNTQVVNDNIASAIEWSGEVYQAMAAEIYTSARMVRTIGRDGAEGQKQLMQTVMDEETGRPVEANSLKDKKFRAYSEAGPAYETLREQTVEDGKGMLQTLAGVPGVEKYTAPIISTIIDNMEGVGVGPLKDMNRKDMLLQGLVKPENEEEEQFLAQAQQPKEAPNKVLMEAAANQQNAEARQLDASSIDKVASAEKKRVEALKIRLEAEGMEAENLEKRLSQALGFVQRLPLPFNNQSVQRAV